MASVSERNLSRRRLAAGAALLGLAGAGAGTPADAASPDAELIEHCTAWHVLERQFLATDFDAPPGTPAAIAAMAEQDRLATAQQPFTDRICASRPSTPEGFKALAGVIVALDCDVMELHAASGHTVDRLMLALLRGLTGQG